MSCAHRAATDTVEQRRRYRTFRCRSCRRRFNERTGTPFDHLQVPTDVVLLVVLWRLRYKLSLRDLAEMFLARGFVFTHETVRERAARFAPLLSACLRAKRRGQAGTRWHADETYVKVAGRQRYYPMRGFGSFASAARFCPAFDEQRQYLRPRTMMGRYLPLADQRHLFQDRWTAVLAELGAA